MDNELEEKIGFCPAMVFQEVDVCVPVEIKAFGEAGNAETECIGKPYIDCRCDECHEKHDKECKFTVTQKLKVKVPLIFGARAEVGKAAVDCDCPRGEGCCAKEE
ncbi:MAG: hypothetical protein Q8882_04070 [Bacillota bacterium]|nr:hypothetical protein [Bacillota bacterium]